MRLAPERTIRQTWDGLAPGCFNSRRALYELQIKRPMTDTSRRLPGQAFFHSSY
jgi:hypothetical protein